jgi:hypothetical protein
LQAAAEKMAVFCGIFAVPPYATRDAGSRALIGDGRKPRKSAGFAASRRNGAQLSSSAPNHREILARIRRFAGMTRCDALPPRPTARAKRCNSRQSTGR